MTLKVNSETQHIADWEALLARRHQPGCKHEPEGTPGAATGGSR